MNLKEAFRYMNYLDLLLSNAECYLSNTLHTTEVTQTHHRKAVDPDATDEVKNSEQLFPVRGTHFNPNYVVDFMQEVLAEKCKLSEQINQAKQCAPFQLDHELAINKVRQRIAHTLQRLGALRGRTTMQTATGYRFNAEGNQTPYTYNVEEVTMPLVPAELARSLAKEYLHHADEVSNQAECFMIQTTILMEPMFDVNDSFDAVVEAYIQSRNA